MFACMCRKPSSPRKISAVLAAWFVMGAAMPALAATGATAPTAKTFLEAIYRSYVGGSQADAKGVALATPAAVRRYFAPGLASLILEDRHQAARRGAAPSLAGDPFIGRQDWQIEGLEIDVKDAAMRAVATVTFTNFGKAEAVVVELLKSETSWQIADIRWASGSLRGLYRPNVRASSGD